MPLYLAHRQSPEVYLHQRLSAAGTLIRAGMNPEQNISKWGESEIFRV